MTKREFFWAIVTGVIVWIVGSWLYNRYFRASAEAGAARVAQVFRGSPDEPHGHSMVGGYDDAASGGGAAGGGGKAGCGCN